ncbi:hypothetical protein [Streptomyces sp. NPDC088554]|uniref:hypothetical protein n=1 Tax=Streptomyces sp. NPDC088554 TaxID=3365865 RepID=UPI003821A273
MVRQGGVRAGWPARGWVEAHGYVSIDAARFGRRVARGGARWETVRGLGRRAAAVQTAPSTGPPVDVQHLASAPELRYRSVLAGRAPSPWGVFRLPSLDERGARRVAVALDDGPAVVLSGRAVDQIVIDTGGLLPSRPAPPASCHRPGRRVSARTRATAPAVRRGP